MEDALRKAAIDSRQLGSKREVSEWAAGAFGKELEARRVALRAATSAQPQRRTAGVVTRSHKIPLELSFRSPVSAPREMSSTVTTALELRTPPPRRRGRLALQVAGAVGVCAMLVALALLRTSRGTAPTFASETPASVVPSSSAPSTIPGAEHSASSASSATALSALPVQASAIPAPSPSPIASSSQSAPKASPRKTRLVSTPTRSAKDNCDPPVVVDAKGVEHFKPGCL
jgi:hypothetical protein